MLGVEQFHKLNVADIARLLGVHPFDVVRILAANDAFEPTLRFEQNVLDKVRKLGEIETWWSAERTIDDDPIPERGVLRAIVAEMLRRGIVGETSTRVDNVFRGMDSDHEQMARRALNLLIREGYASSHSSPTGNRASLRSETLSELKELVEGRSMPAGLAALWLA